MNSSRPKVKAFEDLRVFQETRALVTQIYDLTRSGAFAKDYALVDQMCRAAVSILSNIAEGFERQTDSEFARSLFIAKGSCGELRAQTMVAYDQKYISTEDYENMCSQCRRISAGLFKLISYLQRSKAILEKPQA